MLLKLAKYFAAASELTTNLSKETNTATIELKEPTTEAKLTMDKTDLSTLNTNNVKVRIFLIFSFLFIRIFNLIIYFYCSIFTQINCIN